MAVNLPPLDPVAQTMLEQVASLGLKPLHECTVDEARGISGAFNGNAPKGPDVAHVEDVALTASDGGASRARLFSPKDPRGLIIYLHGGGWVLGEMPDFEPLVRLMVQESGWAVLQVDYRLAPEHRFPAAVLDAEAALLWGDRWRTAAGLPLAVLGDSAGGNLSAVSALIARDRGVALAAQVLVYPVTDHDFTGPASYTDPATQKLLSAEGMKWFWDHYLPDAGQRSHPHASPLRAESLAGLAPAVVLSAGYDPLRDEGEAYAVRLMDAGVPVAFRRFADQFHGFFTMPYVLPGAADSRRFALKAMLAVADL